MEQNLGIAFAGKTVAGAQELTAQLLVVVDLAVESDDQIAVFVFHRLVTGVQIDDGQPSKAHGDVIIQIAPLAIWPTVYDAIRHSL